MDFEFDKEIDFLLRQTAQGEAVSANQNSKFKVQNSKFQHLDADELSAFTENALPEKAKQKYLVHLADCDECRKNLSSLIVLNVDSPEETARIEERQFVPTPVPWYRKLFAVPNLIYTMGALVLLFSGIAVWTVLQSVNDSQSPTVSQTYEKQTGGKGMSSDGDASVSESYSSNSATASNMMSNTAAMNSSVATSANSPANAATMPGAPYSTANSNAAIALAERDKDSKGETKSLAPAKEPMDLAKADSSGVPAAPPPAQMSVNSREYTPTEEEVLRQEQQASIAQNQADIMPDSRSVKRAPALSPRMEGRNKKTATESKGDAAEKSKNATATSGGKNFRREENVWYDAAYRGQPTVNVTRGTSEYKKLDAGLRSIVENLGGTIVVVWKQKAYRIQ